MNCLLVGGGGFIGAYTIRMLMERGHNVVVYDIMPTRNSLQQVLTEQQLARVSLVKGDVLDVINLMHVAKENEVEKIVHLAGALVPDCQEFPARSVQINIDGFINVLEVARLLGVVRVVYASSIGVYGTQSYYGNQRIDEDAPVNPTVVYGACKAFNEFMGRHYFEHFGVDTIGLRFPLVYGPFRLRGYWTQKILVEMIEKPAIGLPGKVPLSSGAGVLNLQYVEDTALSIVLALEKEGPTRSRVFNACGDLRPVDDAVAFVRTLLPDVELTMEKGRSDVLKEGPAHDLDARRIEEELGYKPRFSMEEGLLRSINFFRLKHGLQPLEAPV